MATPGRNQERPGLLAGSFPADRAVQRLYGLGHLPAEREMVELAERWRPYRSLAVSYLFASPLQRSDEPSTRQIRQAIATATAAYGARGCAARVAQDYGEHPDAAASRMRWARQLVLTAAGRR